MPKGFVVLALAFFLFRGFDIIKPPPVNYMERIRGGLGVMLDDVAAGLYVNIILQIATRMRFSDDQVIYSNRHSQLAERGDWPNDRRS